MPLRLCWTKINPDGPGLHSPQRLGDVGWDLEAAEDIWLAANQQVDVPTNVRVGLPQNCWGEIRARSSIARMGLQVDAGVIDNGYTGPLFVLLRNMNQLGDEDRLVHQGMRIAQLVLHVAVFDIVAQEVDELSHDPRRGEAAFGSTGGLTASC